MSLWWIAGLVVQGGYSLPVTRYTETYEVVADAATAPEVLRGLGYWFFYGNDKFGQWIEPSVEYTQGVWLLFVSFGLVVLALLGAALVRWRHRSFFVLLVVVGGLVAIGSHPFDSPSPLGRLFKEFTTTDAGLALRSTPRVLPLLVLATAVLLGALVNVVEVRFPARGRILTVLVLAGVVLNNPAMWRIRMVEEHLDRDEDIPRYWLEAIDSLDGSGRDRRVLELPGSDFASYRWGNTVDPITPGFLDRGYVARELVPFGSAQSAALLTAFDRRFQEDTVDLDAVVPVARLMSVDDIVHRADLTFERFRTPRPVPTGDLLERVPGLGPAVGFGPPVPNVAGPEQPMRDEVFLATDPALADPAPVTAYTVPEALDIVRIRPEGGGTVVVGDADGLVDAAGAGLLALDGAVWFAADLVTDSELRQRVLAEPTTIVVTDTNRKRAKRWGTLRENVGHTERAGEVPLTDDPTDNRLPVFPAVEATEGLDPDDTRTVSVQSGSVQVQATAYGNPVTYTNDDRPVHAVDGDLATAWVVAAFGEARGERLRLELPEPAIVRELTLIQPLEPANRHITEVRVLADGRDLGRFPLGTSSRTAEGEIVRIRPSRPASVYEIELTDLDVPVRATYPGVSPVGFAEVRLDGVPTGVEEALRTPVALLDRIGPEADRHSLHVVLTRDRSNPREPVREDPEPELRRIVPLPGDRTFEISGAARVSAAVPEPVVDTVIGRTTAADGTPAVARSSGRLPGDLRSAASFAFDADRTTAWTGRFGPQAGQWVELALGEERRVEGSTVHVVTDADHSVPTRLRVIADGTALGEFDTGLSLRDAPRGTTVAVDVPVSVTASRLRFEAVHVAERVTQDWYSNAPVAMPISVAEIEAFADVHFGPPGPVETGCIELGRVDGVSISGRITGSAGDALARRELAVEGCGPVTGPAGGFTVSTAARRHGFDVDQLVLSSPRPVEAGPAGAAVTVVRRDDTSFDLLVPGSTDDRWLVLGQSHNDGWEATIGGRSLGPPVVIDGFANGWLLPAGGDVAVALRWTPQRLVDRAMVLSAIALLVVAVAAARGRRDSGPSQVYRPDGPAWPAPARLPLLDRRPDASSGLPVAAPRVVAGGVVAAVFAFLNLAQWPLAPLAVGAMAILALARGRWWSRPALSASLLLGITALAIMVEQRRFRHPPDFVWPQQFEDVHVLGVLVLLLLFADYVRSAVAPEGSRRR